MIEHKITTQEVIQKELKRFRDLEIPYDYRQFGSKYLAKIKLTNGKSLMICPYRKNITYLNKAYKYKFLPHWLNKNNLKVQY